MALTKVNYIDNETAITADQMNAIQDEIIANSKSREYGYGAVLPTVAGSTDEEFLANIEALCAEKIKMSTFQAILYPPGEAFDGNSFVAQIFHNTIESNGNKFIKIKAHGVTTTSEFQRVCYGSTWNEPEWENPPMLFGVEYRTTERSNGSPVYAQQVYFGNLPNNAEKSYTFDGLTNANVVRYDLILSAYNDRVDSKLAYFVEEVLFNNSGSLYCIVKTNTNATLWVGYLTIYYTK